MRGHSSRILGPWTPTRTPRCHTSRPLHPHPSYRSRSSSDFSRFFTTRPPTGDNACARIATRGHIGGNDLPGQGQRLPHQSLRQWNSTIKMRKPSAIIFSPTIIVFFLPFVLPFKLYLAIFSYTFSAFGKLVSAFYSASCSPIFAQQSGQCVGRRIRAAETLLSFPGHFIG